MNLQKLLNPNGICVIGASEKDGFGADTCRNIIKYMDEDQYFFVNPRRETVLGVKCYPSVAALPRQVDLVIVCTPRNTIETMLREAHTAGARAAIVYASGYSEVGTAEGRAAQESLVALARELDMPIMGPNCGGFINYVNSTHAFAFITPDRDRKGSVGLASQSGQICITMMENPSTKFSYAISSGNSAVIQMEDYIDYMVDDENTKVVAVYLEGSKNPKKLIAALRKAALKRKPVVVLKTGRSAKGMRLAASHTGSLAGADKVYDAIFKKFGVIRVNDIEELIAASMLFATLKKLPDQPTVASMCLSGGETGTCADVGELMGIEYPDFSEETLAKLRELLPFYATPANPLDMTATLSYDEDLFAEGVLTVAADPNIGLVCIGLNFLQEIADPTYHKMAGGIMKASQAPDAKPIVVVSFAENTRNEEYFNALIENGVYILPATVYAFQILRYLADFIKYDPADHDLDMAVPESIISTGKGAYSEFESRKLLAEYGFPAPSGGIATTEDEAVTLAESVGYPVVMKIDSVDILHKSDIGGVKINVKDEASVRAAYNTILGNAKEKAPQARIGGVYVTAMAPAGTEMIIGVSSDKQFGPCVLVGMGGVFVEVFGDVALCPAPVSKKEALSMIGTLKSVKLLSGYRGNAPLDIDALAEAIVSVSKFAVAHKESLAELDINPVFLYEKGLTPADALIIMR